MKHTFNQISQSAVYRQDDVSVSITVCGGSYGEGSETLVVEQEHCDIGKHGKDNSDYPGRSGGAVMNWNYNELSPALRAEMKQHLPVIVLKEEHESSDNVRNEIC